MEYPLQQSDGARHEAGAGKESRAGGWGGPGQSVERGKLLLRAWSVVVIWLLVAPHFTATPSYTPLSVTMCASMAFGAVIAWRLRLVDKWYLWMFAGALAGLAVLVAADSLQRAIQYAPHLAIPCFLPTLFQCEWNKTSMACWHLGLTMLTIGSLPTG